MILAAEPRWSLALSATIRLLLPPSVSHPRSRQRVILIDQPGHRELRQDDKMALQRKRGLLPKHIKIERFF